MIEYSEIDGVSGGIDRNGNYKAEEFIFALENEKSNSYLDITINQDESKDRITVSSLGRDRLPDGSVDRISEFVEFPSNRTGERLFGKAYDIAVGFTPTRPDYDPAQGLEDSMDDHVMHESDESTDENSLRSDFLHTILKDEIENSPKAQEHIINGSMNLIMDHFSPEQQGRLFSHFIKNGCK